MGLIQCMYDNCHNPQGRMGRFLLSQMNGTVHKAIANWGFSQITWADGESILDVGFGGGGNIQRILQRLPSSIVCGVDVSSEAVRFATRLNQMEINRGRCILKNGRADEIPFESGSFDTICAVETIYFWDPLAVSFKEVKRVLRTGGTFLVVQDTVERDARSLNYEKKVPGMRAYTASDIREALSQAGFTSIDMKANSKHSWVAFIARV